MFFAFFLLCSVWGVFPLSISQAPISASCFPIKTQPLLLRNKNWSVNTKANLRVLLENQVALELNFLLFACSLISVEQTLQSADEGKLSSDLYSKSSSLCGWCPCDMCSQTRRVSKKLSGSQNYSFKTSAQITHVCRHGTVLLNYCDHKSDLKYDIGSASGRTGYLFLFTSKYQHVPDLSDIHPE